MVSALDSGLSSLGLSPGLGSDTLQSQGLSPNPGV